MTSISKTFRLHHAGGRRHADRSFWQDAGIGLAAVLTVLVMAVAVTRGTSGVQTTGAWPAMEEPKPLGGWEASVPPDLFPARTFTGVEYE